MEKKLGKVAEHGSPSEPGYSQKFLLSALNKMEISKEEKQEII